VIRVTVWVLSAGQTGNPDKVMGKQAHV